MKIIEVFEKLFFYNLFVLFVYVFTNPEGRKGVERFNVKFIEIFVSLSKPGSNSKLSELKRRSLSFLIFAHV